MLTCTFVNSFKPRYEKTGKRKLRCFPQCSQSGHQNDRFCGRPIICRLGQQNIPSGQELRLWGEFVLCDGKQGMSGAPDEEMVLNKIYDINSFLKQERTVKSPTLPLFRGIVKDTDESKGHTIMFNQQLLGWHYSWQSSKNKCDAFHNFRVHVFLKPYDSNFAQYIGFSNSPDFQLYSRHRIRKLKKVLGEHKVNALIAEGSLLTYDPASIINSSEEKTENSKSQRMNSSTKEIDMKSTFEVQQLLHQLRAGLTPSEKADSPASMTQFTKQIQELAELQQKKNKKKNSRARKGVKSKGKSSNESDQDYYGDEKAETHTIRGRKRLRSYELVPDNKRDSLTMTRLITLLVFFGNRSGGNKSGFGEEGNVFSEESLEQFASSLFTDLVGNLLPEDLGYILSDGTGFDSLESIDQPKPQAEEHLLGVSGLEGLRAAVREKGSKQACLNFEQFSSLLEELAASIVTEKDISESLDDLFNRWSKRDTKKRKKSRKAKALENSMNVEDIEVLCFADSMTSFDAGEKPGTVYDDIQRIVFKFITDFLRSKSLTLEFFYEIMDIAASSRILPFDSEFPPRPIVARFIQLQLYGNTRKFTEQDYGSSSGRFNSVIQKVQWRRDLYRFQQNLFRFAVIARIKQERKFSKLPSPATPVVKNADVSGTWIRAGVDEEEASGFAESIKQLHGIDAESFFGQLMEGMFRKITVSICQEAILLQGEKKLMTNASFLFYLDSKPHAFVMPQPIPFPGNGGNHWVTSWLSEDKDGKYSVKVVGGGLVALSPSSTFANSNKSNSTTRDFVEVRMPIRLFLAQDKSILHVHVGLHIFQNGKKAPKFESRDELSKLFLPNSPSEISNHKTRFVRYLNYESYSEHDLSL